MPAASSHEGVSPANASTRAGAAAHFRAGLFPEAKAAYERALVDDPANAGILQRLGRIALLENRPAEAVRYFERAAAAGPALKRHWPLNAAATFDLAMAHYRMDRFPEAARLFAKAAGPVPVGPLKELAEMGRHLAMFGDDPPYRIEGPDTTILQFMATDPLPVVKLGVNGGPPALFVVDTGGAELVLDAAFATEVGAEIAGALNGEYAGGKRAKTGLGRVDSIHAGEMRVEQVPIHTLELGTIDESFGMDIRGIVGTRFLMHFLSTIDYAGGALILRRDVPETRRDVDHNVAQRQAAVIPFWLVDTHLMLARGSLNGRPPTLFLVDTGLADKAFLASEATFRAAGVAVDWSAAYEGPGGGGSITGTDVTLDWLTLGEGDHVVTRRDVAGSVHRKAPSVLGDGHGFEIGGLISHAFFRSGALTLDFTGMRLILDGIGGLRGES